MAETEKPRAKGDMKCPLWRKPMKLVCHTCEWWVHIRGKHPQGEEIIDHWGCAIAWMPMLMIENAQMSRQTGAAVESFRNEVIKVNEIEYRRQHAQQLIQAGPDHGGRRS
jgi:hypothetical protein